MELSLDFPFTTILTILIITFLITFHFKNKRVNLPPGKLGWPLIGETFEFATSSRGGYIEKFTVDRMIRYSPKVFKTSLLGEKMAVICDPPGNKFIFSNENKLVRSWFPSSLVKIITPGLTLSPQDEFLRRRRLSAEFLKPDAVHKYVDTMDYITKQHMEKEWAPYSNITVFPLAKRLAFEISCCLFMGIDYPDLIVSLMHHFEIVGDGFLSVPIDLPGTTYRRAVNAAKFMRTEFEKIIREKKKQSSQGSIRNLMSHLLSATDENGKMLDESDIANMLIGILIASHETTSSLLTNIVYFLADHPHVYEQALKEQLEIKRLKGAETLTCEDTRKMKYCRNVINEVLRLATPLGGVFREVIHDISYEGFTIPKGWKIFCSVKALHKDPKYFPNPNEFDPSRFDGDGPPPYSFTPFGGGPRMCPGFEFARQIALVFMHNLLINFKWEKLIPNEKIILAPSSFPAKGLPIKLQRRADNATV